MKKDKMGMSCGIYRVKRNTNKLQVRNPEGKRQLEGPMNRWDNIKMGLKEMESLKSCIM